VVLSCKLKNIIVSITALTVVEVVCEMGDGDGIVDGAQSSGLELMPRFYEIVSSMAPAVVGI